MSGHRHALQSLAWQKAWPGLDEQNFVEFKIALGGQGILNSHL